MHRVYYVFYMFGLIEFANALEEYHGNNPDIPAEMQWFKQDKTVSLFLKGKQIKSAQPFIYDTFPKCARVLRRACDTLSEQYLKQQKQHTERLTKLANDAAIQQDKVAEKLKNKNSSNNHNENNNNNDNNNNDENDVDIVSNNNDNNNNNEINNNNEHQKNSDKKPSIRGKKSRKKKQNKNEQNELVNVSMTPEEISQSWTDALHIAASKIGCLFVQCAKLSNKSAQTLSALEKTKADYTMMYLNGVNGITITMQSVVSNIKWLALHEPWSFFWKPIIREGWEVYQDVNECQSTTDYPSTKVEIKKAAATILNYRLNALKQTLLTELNFADLNDLVQSPLVSINEEKDSETRNYKACSAVWKHIQQRKDSLYLFCMESYFMAKAHFLRLLKLFAPAKHKKVIDTDLIILEMELKKLVPYVISRFALDRYKNRFNNDPTQYPVEYDVVVAMQAELRHWLISTITLTAKGASKDTWIKQTYHPIFIGLMIPFLLITHACYLNKLQNNLSAPVAATCHPPQKMTYLYRHMQKLSTLMLRWFQNMSSNTNAKRQLQPSVLNTVYPTSLKMLLQECTVEEANVLHYCRFLCSFGSFLYCIFIQSAYKGTSAGLGTLVGNYCSARGDWMNDIYWDRTSLIPLPLQAPEAVVVAVEAPVCSGIAACWGEKYVLPMKSKFPDAVIGPNGYVAIIVDEYVTGFNLMFKAKRGLKFNVDHAELIMDWYNSHCFRVTSSKKLERLWSFIKKNNKYLHGRIIGYLQLGSPVGPHSPQIKWLHENVGGWDTRKSSTMFTQYFTFDL